MIAAFAMVQWAVGLAHMSYLESLYLSGTTFITLGMGVPHTRMARAVLVLEAGVGFGFLALVISYLPVLYQSFAQRETNILLLDARAGSPPTAAELFRRYAKGHGLAALDPLLKEWEIWSADLLETYISYPVLAYFRSQHDNQSWLAALNTILDLCAVMIAGIDGLAPWQARLTFAMARHTVVDLAQIVNAPPKAPEPDRLPRGSIGAIQSRLGGAGDRARQRCGIRRQTGAASPHVRAIYFRAFPAIPGEPVQLDAGLQHVRQLAHQCMGAQFQRSAAVPLRRRG